MEKAFSSFRMSRYLRRRQHAVKFGACQNRIDHYYNMTDIINPIHYIIDHVKTVMLDMGLTPREEPFLRMSRYLRRRQHAVKFGACQNRIDHPILRMSWMDAFSMDLNKCGRRIERLRLERICLN